MEKNRQINGIRLNLFGVMSFSMTLLTMGLLDRPICRPMEKLGRSLGAIFEQLEIPRSSVQTIVNTSYFDMSPLLLPPKPSPSDERKFHVHI